MNPNPRPSAESPLRPRDLLLSPLARHADLTLLLLRLVGAFLYLACRGPGRFAVERRWSARRA